MEKKYWYELGKCNYEMDLSYETIYSAVDMTAEDKIAYEKHSREDMIKNYVPNGDFDTYGDPRDATHWIITYTKPEEWDSATPEERLDITWWDMCVFGGVYIEGKLFVYCPEFGFSWWQACYTETQCMKVCGALTILAIAGELAENHEEVWKAVHSMYDTRFTIEKTGGKDNV